MADNTNLKMWREAAAESKDCLPLEELEKFTGEAPAGAKGAAHLESCAHCQTELSMLKNFETATPSEDEGAAVAWIAAQLQRQQVTATKPTSAVARVPFWRNLFRVPYLAGAAALAAVLVLAISLYKSDSGPGPIKGTEYGTSYRGGLKLLGPSGDLVQPPGDFRWEPVQGASSYKLELTDALGKFLAGATSTQPQLTATPEMKAAMHSGMPFKWKVTALDASGKSIAESSGGSFKIK